MGAHTGKGRVGALRIAAAVAVLGSLAAIGSVALAASTPAGGNVRMFGVPKGGGGNFMFTGAIGDYGSTQRMTASGTPNVNGGYVKFTLKQGTFVANATGFFNALNKAKFSFSAATCSVSFAATGPATLAAGTGQYAGISGTIKVSGTFAEIAPRRKNGKCNDSQNAKPVAQFNAVTGSGKVSFS